MLNYILLLPNQPEYNRVMELLTKLNKEYTCGLKAWHKDINRWVVQPSLKLKNYPVSTKEFVGIGLVIEAIPYRTQDVAPIKKALQEIGKVLRKEFPGLKLTCKTHPTQMPCHELIPSPHGYLLIELGGLKVLKVELEVNYKEKTMVLDLDTRGSQNKEQEVIDRFYNHFPDWSITFLNESL